MKKILFLLFTTFVTFGCNGQKTTTPENEISASISMLVKGITSADENILKDITADELIYGHSGGKVQNKSEFIAEIVSGQPLDYVSIELSNQTIKVSGQTAVVRHIFTSETLSNGVPGNLKIGNMLIWQLQNGKWKLLARQAYRLQ